MKKRGAKKAAPAVKKMASKKAPAKKVQKKVSQKSLSAPVPKKKTLVPVNDNLPLVAQAPTQPSPQPVAPTVQPTPSSTMPPSASQSPITPNSSTVKPGTTPAQSTVHLTTNPMKKMWWVIAILIVLFAVIGLALFMYVFNKIGLF
jgi:hypothetical protein